MVGIRFSRRAAYQRFADMYIEGLSIRKIARVCACDRATVTSTIGRLMVGGDLLPPSNAGKRHKDRYLSEALVTLLEELYAVKEDLFVDEAQIVLQHFSTRPISQETVRRELHLLGLSNKKARCHA